jgi:dTDP-glucose 4,6-dehydratase
VVVTRCSNNYGPYQYPEKMIPLFVTNAIQDEPLPVYGTGRNVRDWIHVEDHVRALDAILKTPDCDGEVFNIGAYNERDVLSIAGRILTTLGKPEGLVRHVVDRPGHDRRYAIAWEKLAARTGWKPLRDFETGIRETVRWYEENPGWWRPLKSGEFLEYYKRNYVFLDGGAGEAR